MRVNPNRVCDYCQLCVVKLSIDDNDFYFGLDLIKLETSEPPQEVKAAELVK